MMKKLLFIFTLLLAFTINANAQEKKVATAQEKAATDATELANLVGIEDSLKDGFTKLFTMKYESLEGNLSAERKQALSQLMEDKLKTSLTPVQLNKLKAKKELYERITK